MLVQYTCGNPIRYLLHDTTVICSTWVSLFWHSDINTPKCLEYPVEISSNFMLLCFDLTLTEQCFSRVDVVSYLSSTHTTWVHSTSCSYRDYNWGTPSHLNHPNSGDHLPCLHPHSYPHKLLLLWSNNMALADYQEISLLQHQSALFLAHSSRSGV